MPLRATDELPSSQRDIFDEPQPLSFANMPSYAPGQQSAAQEDMLTVPKLSEALVDLIDLAAAPTPQLQFERFQPENDPSQQTNSSLTTDLFDITNGESLLSPRTMLKTPDASEFLEATGATDGENIGAPDWGSWTNLNAENSMNPLGESYGAGSSQTFTDMVAASSQPLMAQSLTLSGNLCKRRNTSSAMQGTKRKFDNRQARSSTFGGEPPAHNPWILTQPPVQDRQADSERVPDRLAAASAQSSMGPSTDYAEPQQSRSSIRDSVQDERCRMSSNAASDALTDIFNKRKAQSVSVPEVQPLDFSGLQPGSNTHDPVQGDQFRKAANAANEAVARLRREVQSMISVDQQASQARAFDYPAIAPAPPRTDRGPLPDQAHGPTGTNSTTSANEQQLTNTESSSHPPLMPWTNQAWVIEDHIYTDTHHPRPIFPRWIGQAYGWLDAVAKMKEKLRDDPPDFMELELFLQVSEPVEITDPMGQQLGFGYQFTGAKSGKVRRIWTRPWME